MHQKKIEINQLFNLACAIYAPKKIEINQLFNLACAIYAPKKN